MTTGCPAPGARAGLAGSGAVRVAYLVPSLAPAGPVRVVLDLVKYLDRSRYSPIVIPLQAAKPDRIRTVSRDVDAEVRPLGLPWWHGSAGLTRLLTDANAGIVHAHCFAPMILAANLGSDVAKLLTLHNWPWLDYAELYGRLKGCLMWQIERRVWPRFDALAPCSRTLAQDLQKLQFRSVIPPGTYVAEVQNGVDPRRFAPVSVDRRAAARRELGIPEDAFVLITVGKLIARKRVGSVISAYLSAKLNNARLIVVGDGPLAQECTTLAAGRGDIVMAGFRLDISSMLSAADVYVSAAATEGLPLSVLEAYRSGLRLLLSDIPAHREILDDCPEAGSVSTVSDLTASIQREYGRGRGLRVPQARRERFGAPHMAERYAELYDRILLSRNAFRERGAGAPINGSFRCNTQLQ